MASRLLIHGDHLLLSGRGDCNVGSKIQVIHPCRVLQDWRRAHLPSGNFLPTIVSLITLSRKHTCLPRCVDDDQSALSRPS